MKRYGYAIKVGGDPEISGALAAGIDRGSSRGPAGGDAVRRAAMWQHSPEEWAAMTEEARVIYGGRKYLPRWAERLLVAYAMICYWLSLAYKSQDRVLGGDQ